MLSAAELVIINPTRVSSFVYLCVNIVSIIFCWLVISALIYKSSLYKVLAVTGVLVAAVIGENVIKQPFNPITIPLLILFWLGLVYLVIPDFFKKYQVAILSIYGAVLSYFFIFRMMPDYVENHHQNFLKLLLIPIPALIILWIYEQWRWLKTLKSDKAKAELKLLKNQINPHFFFNTLNNLYGLAVEKSELAPAMILKLSDIMRYTIYDGRADYVPLKEEATYLADYIELHKIRYYRKVDISFYKNLQHPHQIAPLLLIIPLENAFKHGIESQVENAFIELAIHTTPDSILFQISNNYDAKLTNKGGIGLNNLKQRLELIYPNRHQIEITQTTDIYTVSLEIKPYEIPNN